MFKDQTSNIWKLTVNTNKTKIVVFNKKKYKTNVVFKIYGQAIDLQDSYSYLGVIFNIDSKNNKNPYTVISFSLYV
jgi:hypothetical protein